MNNVQVFDPITFYAELCDVMEEFAVFMTDVAPFGVRYSCGMNRDFANPTIRLFGPRRRVEASSEEIARLRFSADAERWTLKLHPGSWEITKDSNSLTELLYEIYVHERDEYWYDFAASL